MTTWNLVLVGFGNVARRFVRLLDERRERLARDYGTACRVRGIATGRHGCVFDPAGIDAELACAIVESGETLTPAALSATAVGCADARELIGHAARYGHDHGVVMETTTLNVRDGEPAATHVRDALAAGLHVVSANKGPVACAYHELRDLAAREGRRFRFEGAVMDGIPIFNLVRDTLPAVEVLGFRGVVNSTTNYTLCEMERGIPFAEALRDMQAQGIAEADASLDVDGWDAAAKAAALVNVMMGGDLRPAGVRRTGIGALTPDDLQQAIARGQRLRLIASARRHEDGTLTAHVGPELVPASDPLAQLAGMANALVLVTDLLGEVAIVQRDGGLTQTAYALLTDLLSLSPAR
jgi:homoserine dehydrogenase